MGCAGAARVAAPLGSSMHRCTIALLVATVACSGAKAQDSSADTLMRAAYCGGVLKGAM